jgi:hypothetical protein
MFRDDRMENNAPDRITERKMDPQDDSPMSGEFDARRTEGRGSVSVCRRTGVWALQKSSQSADEF